MAATNRYMFIGTTTFTVNSTPTPITGIKSFDYDEGISTKKEAADADRFPTVSVTDFREPKFSINTIDAAACDSIQAGVRGTLLVTVLDALNGAAVGGGGKAYTMSNAQIEGRTSKHQHREYGTRTLEFGAISSDGVTHPVSVTAL